jgi:hypothetical protein
MTSAASQQVHRYCFVRLHEELTPTRNAMAVTLRAELTSLCGPHPVWIGVPGDDSAARWDLSIVLSFPDLMTWQAVAAAVPFQACMARLDAAAAVLKAWTFATPETAAG